MFLNSLQFQSKGVIIYNNETILHITCRRGFIKLSNYLLLLGASPLINNNISNTPLSQSQNLSSIGINSPSNSNNSRNNNINNNNNSNTSSITSNSTNGNNASNANSTSLQQQQQQLSQMHILQNSHHLQQQSSGLHSHHLLHHPHSLQGHLQSHQQQQQQQQQLSIGHNRHDLHIKIPPNRNPQVNMIKL
jgi:hypothetical protein